MFSERRAGRRGRRQKNATKLFDGGQQPVSSGKETTEFGQSTHSDRLQGEFRLYVCIYVGVHGCMVVLFYVSNFDLFCFLFPPSPYTHTVTVLVLKLL